MSWKLMDMLMVAIAPLAALLGLVGAAYFAVNVMGKPKGTERMREIAQAISEGAMAYMSRQFRTIAPFAVLLALIFAFALPDGPAVAAAFLFGAISSALAAYIGMALAVRANVRAAQAAESGLNSALQVAIRGGAVTGLAVVGLGLLGVSVLYYLVGASQLLIYVGYGVGASLISLFARVGGGIYTKAADVGADLVGKVEKDIPEDDPRNPAVIADNVGDNVGDCAGMGADLFESYVVTMVASVLLAATPAVFALYGMAGVAFPLLLGAVGVLSSIVGVFFVRTGEDGDAMGALYKGLTASSWIAFVLIGFLAWAVFGSFQFFIAADVGLATTLLLIRITEYYTAREKPPVISIAKASMSGAGTNVITGLAVGFKSTLYPTLVICAAIAVSYAVGGLYGIAVAAMGMLASTGLMIAIDSYGPITDNAGGIAEMAKMSKRAREVTDALDAVGNTTKATTKGFAIGGAAVSALTLLAAYAEETNISAINILQPNALIGLFIGALLPFVFSGFTMEAVGKAAFEMVKEVRRQFHETPGIMTGKAKPDYARCVDISTRSALRELLVPGLMAICVPLAVGLLFGPVALGGMLIGAIMTGFLLAIMLCTAGAAWDNAKKYIEMGNFGSKGSEAHKAAVIGDTFGDPAKDTSGPALNALIKVLNTVSLIFAGVIVAHSLHLLG